MKILLITIPVFIVIAIIIMKRYSKYDPDQELSRNKSDAMKSRCK